jgi:hypothetical protein
VPPPLAASSPPSLPPSSAGPAQETGATSSVETRAEAPPLLPSVVVRAGESAPTRIEEEQKKQVEPPAPRPWFEEMLVDHSARGRGPSSTDDWPDEEDGCNGQALCDYDPLEDAE